MTKLNFKPTLDNATNNTSDIIEKAQYFFTENEKRFRMVLSNKKAEQLEENIRLARYATALYGMERSKSIYNFEQVSAKEQFESLPEPVQILRLRQLNQTIHNALNGNKTPIHLKCRNLEKGFKRFFKDDNRKTFSSMPSAANDSEELDIIRQELRSIYRDVRTIEANNDSVKFAANSVKQGLSEVEDTLPHMVAYRHEAKNEAEYRNNVLEAKITREACVTSFKKARDELLANHSGMAIMFSDMATSLARGTKNIDTATALQFYALGM